MATKKAAAVVVQDEPEASGKELRVQVAMALPADMFRQAEIIAGLRGPLDALTKALPGAVVTHAIVTPRPAKPGAAPGLTPIEAATEAEID